MAQVPYSGTPQVAPDLRPTPSVNLKVEPQAFGLASAEAKKHLGDTVSQVGNELFTRAYAMQELNQSTDAVEKTGKFADKLGDLQLQYHSLEGKAAVDGYQDFKSAVDNAREEIGATLTSPQARLHYLNESRAMQTRAVIGASTHAGDQQKKYVVGTEQSSVDSSRRAVASNPEDDSLYDANLKKVDGSADNMQVLKGWSKEQRDDYSSLTKSNLVVDRVRALAQTGKVSKAQDVLDEAVKAGNISGEDAGRVGEYVRNHRNNVTSRVESTSLLAGEGGHFGEGKVSPERLLGAISSNESGGNYNPPHPEVTHTVNGQRITEHALGRYGIMQSNLRPWLREAGMPLMSDNEFLGNHDAQDKLAKFKLNQYQEQYGSANKAAMVWFTGSPNPDASANDGHSSAPAYLKNFNRALAKSASAGDVDEVSEKRAKEIIPDDEEFKQVFRDRTQIEHQRAVLVGKREDQTKYNTISQALTTPDENGKLITSIDQIPDPKLRDSVHDLPQETRSKLNDILISNAKDEYADTPQGQQKVLEWMGRLHHVQSKEEMEEVLGADFANMNIPNGDKLKLLKEQEKLHKSTQADPNVGHAMGVIERSLGDAMPKKRTSDYYNLAGAVDAIIKDRIESTGKKPDEEEIRDIGARLSREQVTSKGYIWDSRGPAYTTDIDPGERDKIVSMYSKRKGVEPTEQEIHNIYVVHKYNELYSKPKDKPKFENRVSPGVTNVGTKPEPETKTGGMIGIRSQERNPDQ